MSEGIEGKIYRNPERAGIVPQTRPDYGVVWIKMSAFKIKSQQTMARGTDFLEVDRNTSLPTFQFIAPNDIIETTSHHWETYDSLVSRLGQKVAEVLKAVNEGKGVGAGLKSFKENVVEIWNDPNHTEGEGKIAHTLNESLGATIRNSKVYNFRLDTPLVYTGSERRSLELNFNLIEEGGGTADIIEPVKTLQALSCSVQTDNLIGVDIPYVFSIETYPIPWINIKYAALKTVQPTFRGPFVGGLPSSCELLLSFESLEPLYRKQYDQDLSAKITFNDLRKT